MKQVLWLTSWYPNKFDQYNGDFIQRHAQAVAPYCKLSVIHVQMVPSRFQTTAVKIEEIHQEKFSEKIVYVKESALCFPFNKLVNQINYERYFKQAIKQYLKLNGKPNLVHVHVPIKAGKLALWLKSKFSIKYILTEHYGIYNDFAQDKYVDRSWWFKYLTKKIIQEAAFFLPVSDSLGKAVNELVIPKKYEVVFNVVDTTIFNYQLILNDDKFWFVHVSTMDFPKNADGILKSFAKAFQQNNNLRLRMIGPFKTELIQLAIQLELSEVVIFTGMLSQKEVANYLQKSNAFILFSNYENMPCVIAEALCCGLPVISSNVGGISEIVNGTNGILLKPRDEEGLTKAMQYLAKGHSDYTKNLISEKAIHMFAFETIGKQITNDYQKISIY